MEKQVGRLCVGESTGVWYYLTTVITWCFTSFLLKAYSQLQVKKFLKHVFLHVFKILKHVF